MHAIAAGEKPGEKPRRVVDVHAKPHEGSGDPAGASGAAVVSAPPLDEGARRAVFLLQADAIDPALLARGVRDPACGGFASFEGWVRDNQLGRPVASLRYEAYEALCMAEGGRLLEEAIRRFGVVRAWAVHRVGLLAVGEIAVWIGVSSPHRREAFEACSWIIDEIKHVLPIWKKEFFSDGTADWTGCPECARAGGSTHRH